MKAVNTYRLGSSYTDFNLNIIPANGLKYPQGFSGILQRRIFPEAGISFGGKSWPL